MDLWREIYSISYSFSLSRRLDGVLRCMRPSRREHNGIMPKFLLILNPLRDKKCVVMLCSIEIESLTGYYFPVRGININRIRNIIHFHITLGRGFNINSNVKDVWYEEKI